MIPFSVDLDEIWCWISKRNKFFFFKNWISKNFHCNYDMNLFLNANFLKKKIMQPPKSFSSIILNIKKTNLHKYFIVLRALHTEWQVVKDAMCHFGPPLPFLGLKKICHIFSIFDQSQSNPISIQLVQFFKQCRVCSPNICTIPEFPVLLSIASEHPWTELYSILSLVMVSY